MFKLMILNAIPKWIDSRPLDLDHDPDFVLISRRIKNRMFFPLTCYPTVSSVYFVGGRSKVEEQLWAEE